MGDGAAPGHALQDFFPIFIGRERRVDHQPGFAVQKAGNEACPRPVVRRGGRDNTRRARLHRRSDTFAMSPLRLRSIAASAQLERLVAWPLTRERPSDTVAESGLSALEHRNKDVRRLTRAYPIEGLVGRLIAAAAKLRLVLLDSLGGARCPFRSKSEIDCLVV